MEWVDQARWAAAVGIIGESAGGCPMLALMSRIFIWRSSIPMIRAYTNLWASGKRPNSFRKKSKSKAGTLLVLRRYVSHDMAQLSQLRRNPIALSSHKPMRTLALPQNFL